MTLHQGVHVQSAGVDLEGYLHVPDGARGVVAFAHGSGSSRHSGRNRHVAAALADAGLGTLLFDLLTPEEGEWDERTGRLRFDIELLTGRVVGAVDWMRDEPSTRGLRVGVFGASTGAAAALWAAALRPHVIEAVVSRGGRPDLAGPALRVVHAPTLLIVGGMDEAVLNLNRRARVMLTCPSELAIVPGATHLFEEPGALDRVAELAADWFVAYLGGPDVA